MKVLLTSLLCVACLFSLLCAQPAAAATEENFVFVRAMPPADGEVERSLSQRDEAAGQTFTYKIYRLDSESADLVTYVTESACIGGGERSKARPFITALRIQPHKPQSFAAATLFDLFTDVYVTDRDGKVRLYKDMTGAAVSQLSDRFKPLCPGV